MSDSLRLQESQHFRPPCSSQTTGVHSDSRPSSQWCHPAISSSVFSFSSCPQSLPASGSFPMSQLFAWDSQSTGVSALASFLPMNTQDWSPLEWTGCQALISIFQKRQWWISSTINKSYLKDQVSLWLGLNQLRWNHVFYSQSGMTIEKYSGLLNNSMKNTLSAITSMDFAQ